MPAVVRGGRRQGPGASAGGRGAAGPIPRGKLAATSGAAALGRLDLPPRAVAAALAAGVAVLALVLATGARAERIGASLNRAVDQGAIGLGLTLKRVHIVGASEEATPAIRRALNLRAGQAITTLDLTRLRADLGAVGWVKDARVIRLLPDTLVVEVTEHDRLAVWQMAGRAAVIDGSGTIIEGADPGRYPGLPLVVGAGAEQAAADILPLVRQRPRLMGRVDALVRVDERRWDLRLRDGSLIQLPASNQEAALIQLDALDQRERLLDLGFARVDLRTPEAVAVRPATPSLAPASLQGTA